MSITVSVIAAYMSSLQVPAETAEMRPNHRLPIERKAEA